MRTDNFDRLTDLWMSDPAFRDAVRRDPGAAIAGRGITLTADERRALEHLQLAEMSDAALEARISKAKDC